ncbi:hypothetical protein FFK22_008750 [Mycobacterium sp. KBS0706]|nr:hypothetical protein FFK22_008750 [Mycobacterium sp. KBS0706]
MFVLGLILVAGASWGGAYMALKGEISSIAAGQAQDRKAAAEKELQEQLALGEAKKAYDEFRVGIQTRVGTLERSDIEQGGDIKRVQQDQSALFAKLEAVNSTLEEVRRTLAVIASTVESIDRASSARLPGDPPGRVRR